MIGPFSDKLDQISGLGLTPTKEHLPLPCLFQSSSSSLVPPEPEQSICMHYRKMKIEESTHQLVATFKLCYLFPEEFRLELGMDFFHERICNAVYAN